MTELGVLSRLLVSSWASFFEINMMVVRSAFGEREKERKRKQERERESPSR